MKKLLIIAAVLIALPALVWAQTPQTSTLSPTQITVNGVFTLGLSVNTFDFGAHAPGYALYNSESTPITATVTCNYDTTWYLAIKNDVPLTRTAGGTIIPQDSLTHKSSGGDSAAAHVDASYTAMTNAFAKFYTSKSTEKNTAYAGKAITCNLQVALPDTQKQGTYQNVVSYRLSVVDAP